MKVLTGHIPQNKDNVGEVLVYDIPATWSHDKLLAELKLWGHVISINTKLHQKYQSVWIKIEFNSFQLAKYTQGDWQVDLGKIPIRWFPISWSLKDRKEYERFQGVIEDLPPSFTTDLMWTDGHLHELLSTQSGLKAFKIVQYEGNRRKLIGYFDSWVNLKISLGTEVRWEYRILRYVSTPFLHIMPAKVFIILAKTFIMRARGAYFWGVLTNCKIRYFLDNMFFSVSIL